VLDGLEVRGVDPPKAEIGKTSFLLGSLFTSEFASQLLKAVDASFDKIQLIWIFAPIKLLST
jgi:hypothetical protein